MKTWLQRSEKCCSAVDPSFPVHGCKSQWRRTIHTHTHTHTHTHIHTHPCASLLHHISGSLTSLIYPDSSRGQKYNCGLLYFTCFGSNTAQTHFPASDRGKMAAFTRGCFSFLFKPRSQPIRSLPATDMKPIEYNCRSVTMPQIKPEKNLAIIFVQCKCVYCFWNKATWL